MNNMNNNKVKIYMIIIKYKIIKFIMIIKKFNINSLN